MVKLYELHNNNTVLPSRPPPTLLVPHVTQCPGTARLQGFDFWAQEADLAGTKLGKNVVKRFITEVLTSEVGKSLSQSGKAYELGSARRK